MLKRLGKGQTERKDSQSITSLDDVQNAVGGAGLYQLKVWAATQLSCAPITASLLCTVFDSSPPPGRVNCSLSLEERRNVTDRQLADTAGFNSLLIGLDLYCAHSYLPTLFSTMVMLGGASGAGCCGYLADRFGRRPVCLVTVGVAVAVNLAIATLGTLHWTINLPLFFFLGLAAGGYMVTNLVCLLEVISTQFWRLGATSLNGWPLALIYMACLGYGTKDWRYYHIGVAVTGAACLLMLYLWVDESPKWLAQKFALSEAVYKRIAQVNAKEEPKESIAELVANINASSTVEFQPNEKPSAPTSGYTYLDLLRYKRVRRYLVPLFYSWVASSVITYGLYFNLGALAGNRYLNLVFTGIFKGSTGVLPFLMSPWVGRKPVLLMGVLATLTSAWGAVGLYFSLSNARDSMFMTIFTVLGVAALDPIWKVNHFYSAELFPTVVRNMARGVCNVGSRFGSVLAPQVAYLAYYHFALPYLVFGVLSLIHFLVCLLYLPETRGRVLKDSMTDEAVEESGEVEAFACSPAVAFSQGEQDASVQALLPDPQRPSPPVDV